MADDWTAEDRTRMAKEREHVASALTRAQVEWRDILEVVEASASAEAAQEALARSFGFSHVQVAAVMDTQFRRVTQADRERIAAELVELRREIDELDGNEM